MGAAAPDLMSPGTRLGKYRIIHRIAFGGMAEIYLARASGIQGFQKYVVLKRILPQFAENHELIRMFLQEARLAAILDHANIAQVHDIGEEGGTFFFTMEYLHGEDVRWIARRLRESGATIPLEHAVHVLIDAAAGVHFAHEKKGPDERPLGIVHRDLSPSNIVITYAGGVKVVDFGVAKIATDPELSGRYSLKGKLAYMSPEQVTQGTVDRRSDVFALGIVLYEMTTGKRLFKAANEIETMRLALEANVAKPSTIVPDYPLELERIVMRALERSPEARYPTARELQVDLEKFARDQKLEISSAALAEWMESSFGPKREIWHSLPDLAEPGSQSTPKPDENTGATRKVTHAEIDVAPSQRRGRGRRTTLITAVAALAVLFVGGGAFGLRHRVVLDQSSAPPASGSGAVLVVAENGNVAIERSEPPPAAGSSAPTAPTAPPAPAAPVVAAAGEERAPRTTRASRASSSARSHRPSGPEALSSAVAKHAPEIRRCFEDLDAGGASQSEISLRFDVGTDGAVKSLAVLPAAVGSTPLGACLVKVGRNTAFAPQPEPLTFRIPLTVQLRHQERSR
jgi:serine/threonine protein kinase